MHLGLFGCLTKLGAKRAELVQKFMKRSRIGFFRNERTRSTPIGPKTDNLLRFILFGCIRDRLVALRNSVQNGPNYCKSSCHEVTSNISQRTHPIHPIGPYTDVLVRSYYLGAFGTVWLPYETRCKTGRTSVKVRATKWRWNFSQRTHPIHPIGP